LAQTEGKIHPGKRSRWKNSRADRFSSKEILQAGFKNARAKQAFFGINAFSLFVTSSFVVIFVV
jgi:hypothetical protein